ncbi:MAG: ABC transporter ATP-binding protein [Williamsia sp.]|nr:ABC transporter ATP-binding protein [Williamsia sp.]
MSAIIQVSSLSKQFKDITAVDKLSFSVQEADVYGFLGQNGAGKSTTIRMLLTLIAPSSGEINLFGMNLRTHRKEILRQVGAVIERPDLYTYLSAYENLSLFARMNGVDSSRRALMEQLELVGLADRAQSRVRTYSQGMKQRLGIAVALVHNPQLIILDEPTNGLDPQGIADMRNLILHLSRNLKKTVLVSSHLLSEIEQVATRMIIIDRGRKMVEGTVEELFDPAKTVLEIETADGTQLLKWLQESPWHPYITGSDAGRVVLQLNKEAIPALNKELVQAGIPVFSLQKKNSLEDYFLHITAGKQYVGTFKD